MTSAHEDNPFIVVDYDGTTSDYAWKILRAIIRVVVHTLNHFVVFPHMFWMLALRPLMYFAPRVYWTLQGFSLPLLLMLVASWSWNAGYTVWETGLDIIPLVEDAAVVIVNHQSTADVPSLMYSFQAKGDAINNMMWIQDMILKYLDFGWVSMMHGDFFLEQKDLRSSQMQRLIDHIRDVYLPRKRKWIVLFPEGGFLRKRRLKSQEYGRKNGFPILTRVTLPRLGALQTLLTSLAPKFKPKNHAGNGDWDKTERPLKWLIDITIGYPDNKPLNMQTILAGTRDPCKVVMHHRAFHITDIPSDTQGLTDWMNQRFVEKEQLLEIFYKMGRFPKWNHERQCVEESTLLDPTPVAISAKKVLLANIFYLIWFIVTCKFFVCPGLAWLADIFGGFS